MLSAKQRAFVDAYCQCWNASEAARQAGYSVKTAKQQGSRLLTNADVLAQIAEQVRSNSLQAGEVLLRLTNIARANIADFLTRDEDGNVMIDRAKVANDHSGVLKRVRVFSDGGMSIELYDAQAALVTLGEALGVLRRNMRIEYAGAGQLGRELVLIVEGLEALPEPGQRST